MNEGRYIYCIIAASESEKFGSWGIGGRGDELHSICFRNVAAVVSQSPIVRYAVSRENTLAHVRAIEVVMKKYFVLPVRFATIAADAEKIKRILEKEYDRLTDLLNMIQGKKELGLKAKFREEVIYSHIIEKYEDIKKLKAEIVLLPPEKTHYQRMEIGRMVEAALEKEKDLRKSEILSCLSPLACETKINPNYGEHMILNAAFLVQQTQEALFDQKIQWLAEQVGHQVILKYVGNLPPFNFVDLVIDTEGA